ncbi:O-antigen ligase family protein [Kytococcus sp. Marseille-QA3725]
MTLTRDARVASALRLLGVVLLFAVLPLVSTPGALDIREPVRRVVIALVLASSTGLWWVEREDPRLPRPVWWSMGAVALASLLATVASSNSWMSVVGRFPRDEGLLMIGAYLAALPVGALLLARQEGRTAAVWSATASGWVLVSMALRDTFAGETVRVTTALGNASTVGIWGLVLSAWLGWVAWRERSKVALGGAAAGGLLVVLGASRGAMLGLVVGSLLSVAVLVRTEGVRRVIVPVGLVVVGIASVLLLPMTRERIFLEQEGSGTNVTVRLMMWRRTLELIADRPLLGVGPSRWVSAVEDGYGPAWQAETAPAPGAKIDAVHNVVLQTAATLGVVGLLAVTALAVTTGLVLLRCALRPWTPDQRDARVAWPGAGLTVGVGVAAALMFAYTEPVFVVPGAALVGGGLAVAEQMRSRQEGECRGLPLGRPVGGLRPGLRWRIRRGVAAAAVVVSGLAVIGTTAVWNAHFQAQRTLDDESHRSAQGFQRARVAAPWDPNPRVRLAEALATAAAGRSEWSPAAGADPGPHRDALAELCPRIGPDQTCLAHLARSEVQAGDPQQGLRTATRALAMGQDDHLSRTAQYEALLASGRPDLAEVAAREHIDRNPELYSGWKMLAKAQQAGGDLASAQDSQARADQLLWDLLEQ